MCIDALTINVVVVYVVVAVVLVDVDVFGHRRSGIVLFNHACMRERGRALHKTHACT